MTWRPSVKFLTPTQEIQYLPLGSMQSIHVYTHISNYIYVYIYIVTYIHITYIITYIYIGSQNIAEKIGNTELGDFFIIIILSLSFRLELIPPRGGVSHADPPSPLVSIISVFFL